MPTPDLWRALADLAIAWRNTPRLDAFARALPRNAQDQPSGMPKILREIQAGAGGLISDPLLLSSKLPVAASLPLGVNEQQIRTAHSNWLEAATRVEAAHRLTLAWLRSRLPGYPNLPAPQLASGSPLTTAEYTNRIIWQPGERAQQLHLRDVPPQIAQALQADAAATRATLQATRDVATALAHTPEWTAFAAASADLDNAARADLRGARLRARNRLTSAAVDEYEPTLALPRDAYRVHVLREEIESLNGTARSYADAFDAADGLIEVAAGSVFGQIACYPVRTIEATDLEVVPGSPTSIRCTTSAFILDLPGPPDIAWLDDPLVPEAVRIMGVTVSFDQTGAATVDLTADVLTDTAVWRGSL